MCEGNTSTSAIQSLSLISTNVSVVSIFSLVADSLPLVVVFVFLMQDIFSFCLFFRILISACKTTPCNSKVGGLYFTLEQKE
jgi:hypothetical protein